MSYMSQADGLLNSLLAYPSAEPVVEGDNIIIGTDRFWLVPEKLKKIGVQYDHNIETITFDCPRYWDGIDMSMMKIYVNYMCSDGTTGVYWCENVWVDKTDSTIMHFDWIISAHATQVFGVLSALICIKKTDASGNEVNHWNSELCTELFVSEGMKCTETPLKKYPDIITQLLTRIDVCEDNVKNWTESTNKELEDWKKLVETERDDWEAAYNADYDARMLKMEQNTSPSAMSKHTKDYINGNPTVMQGHVNEYMENNNQIIEYVNDFVTDNMDSLITAGLLEINHKAVIERSGSVAPTVKGNGLLDNIKGDSYQKRFTGQNLYNAIDYANTTDHASVDSEGWITIECDNTNGTSDVFTNHFTKRSGLLKPLTPYAIVCEIKEISNCGLCIFSNDANEGQFNDSRYVMNAATHIVLVESKEAIDDAFTMLRTYSLTNAGKISKVVFRISVLEDVGVTTDTFIYEPYCGGAPSPNPDYPQDIRSVGDTGWFDGELRQGTYDVGGNYIASDGTTVCNVTSIPCKGGDLIAILRDVNRTPLIYWRGDNGFISSNSAISGVTAPSDATHFDFVLYSSEDLTPSTVGYVCVTINGEYILKIKQVGENLWSLGDFKGNGILISKHPFYLPKGTYTLSLISSATSGGCDIYFSDGITSKTVYFNNKDCNNRNSYTFTLNNDNKRIGIYSNTNTKITDVQLVPGSVTKSFRPYAENNITVPLANPLRGIGDVRDEIVCHDGVYGVLRRIGRYVFDGSNDETWLIENTYTSSKCRVSTNYTSVSRLVKRAIKDTDIIPSICNSFPVVSSGDTWLSRMGVSIDIYGRVIVYHDYLTQDINTWNNFLAENNMSFEYQLATPVFEPFEDQSIFWDFKSYEGTTNIHILGSNENVTPVATILLPKTVDGSLGNHAIVRTREHEEHIEEVLGEQTAFINETLADGRIRFRIGDDGELEYSIYTEGEAVEASVVSEEEPVEEEV